MTNTMIRASAGSGKTFQLSNQYIQHVFHGVPVDSILASTFTRKAAGEILDRILQRLASAALDGKSRKELSAFVTLPEPGTAEKLQSILAGLARNLFRLRISTLDSFFNKIASVFALELGFPPGWSILDEIEFERSLNEAIRRVLADSEKNEARKLMNLLQKGEQDRNVTRELLDLARQFLPLVRETKLENWDHPELLEQELGDEELQKAIDQFENAPVPLTLQKKPRSSFVKAKQNLVPLAMRGEWKDFLHGSTMISNVAAGNDIFDGQELEGELLFAVKQLIRQAKAVLLNKLVGQTLATRQLLELVVLAYDEILFRRRAFRFEDVTQRLARDDFSPALELLAHRMDSRTGHLLLDEFQDTSMPQWNVVRPFAEEASAAKNGSFFVVGDVKQAIYAWRGGVAGIFETIKEEIRIDEERSLDVSFRSSPIVIETVNRVFGSIASNGALDKYSEASETWNRRFRLHDVAKKNKTKPGHCVLEVAPTSSASFSSTPFQSEDEEEIDEDKLFFEYTVRRIKELHETRPGASIGVLVARNKQIGAIIAGLKGHGIEASEEGGNALTDSAAVLHVLSAMILADHPGDRIARFHLANGPLAGVLKLDDDRNDVQAASASLWIRSRLMEKGYGATIEDFVRELAPSCNPREFQRLERLLELAHRFQENATGVRTQAFIDLVRTEKVESPSASPVRVMTIHKSKGLEFDIVVLPDLDNRLVKQSPKIIVGREKDKKGKTSPTAPVQFVLRYVGKEIQSLLPPEFQEAFEHRIQGEVEEQLSVLYVAMTRAIHELIMIVPPSSKSARDGFLKGKPVFSSTFAGVLRAALMNSDPDADILYESGSADWFRKAEKKIPEKSPLESLEILECSLAEKPGLTPRNLPRITPSGLEKRVFRPKIISELDAAENATEYVGVDRDDAMLWGTAMHACFEYGLETNPWLDRGEPDFTDLERAVQNAVAGKKGHVEAPRVVDAFLKACEKPVVRRTLSLSAYSGWENRTVEVEHERRFAVRLPENRLLRGSVDRLVIFRENGKIVGLDVIDFKTDRPNPNIINPDIEEFLSQSWETYRPQLEAYREGMSLLFRLDPSKITTRLLFVSLDRVLGDLV